VFGFDLAVGLLLMTSGFFFEISTRAATPPVREARLPHRRRVALPHTVVENARSR
jgi:hypothetical protein